MYSRLPTQPVDSSPRVVFVETAPRDALWLPRNAFVLAPMGSPRPRHPYVPLGAPPHTLCEAPWPMDPMDYAMHDRAAPTTPPLMMRPRASSTMRRAGTPLAAVEDPFGRLAPGVAAKHCPTPFWAQRVIDPDRMYSGVAHALDPLHAIDTNHDSAIGGVNVGDDTDHSAFLDGDSSSDRECLMDYGVVAPSSLPRPLEPTRDRASAPTVARGTPQKPSVVASMRARRNSAH